MKSNERLGLLSLFAVYLLWGSTFLGIRLAVETIPPMIAAMARHGFGGLVLAIVLLLSHRWVIPSRREWSNSLWIGALSAGISNGSLMIAEVNVPSAYASIAFTTMPLFMLVLNAFAFERVTPSKLDWLALPLGLVGSGLVVLTGESLSGAHIDSSDIALLVLSPSMWAFASLMGRRVALPKNVLVSSSIQMIGGSILLAVLSMLHGDWWQFRFADVSSRSAWGLLYLSIGGSLLGFTAFATAIKHLEPRVVATYAFVNPVVAVSLGYFFGEEIGRPTILLGAMLSVLAVILTFVGARYRSMRLAS